jgi:hypothetical protein
MQRNRIFPSESTDPGQLTRWAEQNITNLVAHAGREMRRGEPERNDALLVACIALLRARQAVRQGRDEIELLCWRRVA